MSQASPSDRAVAYTGHGEGLKRNLTCRLVHGAIFIYVEANAPQWGLKRGKVSSQTDNNQLGNRDFQQYIWPFTVGSEGQVGRQGSLFHHDGMMVPSRWNDGSITMEQTKMIGMASKCEGRNEQTRGACRTQEQGVREECGGV